MFFQNKWAFRWARRWRWFHGVPRNHGNPVTPLSGHGVSLPGTEGISGRSRRREKAVTPPLPSLASLFDYPNSFLSFIRSSSSEHGEEAKEGRRKTP